jgi:MFS family permease
VEEMTAKEKSILFAVCACHALIHAYVLIFPTIYKSLGSALNLDFAGVGFIGLASYMAFGFGSLPAGFLSDRLGASTLLVICMAGTTLASIMAFVVTTPAGVVIALVLLGLFGSLYHPAGLSLLSTSIREGLGKALGIHGMAGTVGVAVAPVIAGTMTAKMGWTYSYLFLGVVGSVIVVFLMAALGFHRMVHPSQVAKDQKGVKEASLNRRLVLIYCIGAVYGLIYRGIMTFFPTYLSERVGFIGDDIRRLGYLTSGILAISIIGPLVGGYLASGRKAIERNLFLVFAIMALLSIGFYFATGVTLIIVAVPMVLLIFGFQPLQNTLIAESSHFTRRGVVYGINYTVAFGIGAFASGIGGVFGERFGLRSIFLLLLGLCIVEMIFVTLSKSMKERSEGDGLSQP